MQEYNWTALRDRTFEEIERVIANSEPRQSLSEISIAIKRNKQYLASFKQLPGKYMLSLEDIHHLHQIYGIDDVYIMTGLRIKALQQKLITLKPLIDSII